MPDRERPTEEVIRDDQRLDRWFVEKDNKEAQENVWNDSNIAAYRPRRSFGD